MTCPKCGSNLTDRMRYCPDCGARQGTPVLRRSRVRGSHGRGPVSRFVLTSVPGDVSIDIPWNHVVRIGRHPSTDLTLTDASVSRFHAELITTEDGCSVEDLDSRNGTFVNGVSVRRITLRDGDELRVGAVRFLVEERLPEATPAAVIPPELLADDVTDDRLQRLAALAEELTHRDNTEYFLRQLVREALEATGADRASVGFASDNGVVTTGVYALRDGITRTRRRIPRSIARHCLEQRTAVITAAADADDRFPGDSIVSLGVRSAMCAPILGPGGEVYGICYVDHVGRQDPFRADDLNYLVALSRIAAAALAR